MTKRLVLGAGLLAAALCSIWAESAAAGAPGITGTYRLVSRRFPDGSTAPTDKMFGLMSISGSTINFTVSVELQNGYSGTFSRILNYKLTPTEISETRVLSVVARDSGSARIDRTTHSSSGPVKTGKGTVEFLDPDMKGGHVPVQVFDAHGMIATFPDGTVDTWVRVD